MQLTSTKVECIRKEDHFSISIGGAQVVSVWPSSSEPGKFILTLGDNIATQPLLPHAANKALIDLAAAIRQMATKK